MDEGIKRKLVGVAVLVVVALILLPQITPKTQNAEYLSKSVPVEENVPDMTMPLPKSMNIPTRAVEIGEVESSRNITLQKKQVDSKIKPEESFEVPVVDGSGQSHVWQIRVGSFAKPENAISLRKKLIKGGYKAFIKQSADGAYVRVFVGPSTQKKQLGAQLVEIESQYKLKGTILPYVGQ
jgi:cell division septation protein DedD